MSASGQHRVHAKDHNTIDPGRWVSRMQVSDHSGILEELQQQLALTQQEQQAERDAAMTRYAELEKALQSAEEHMAHDQLHAAELQSQLDEASAKLEVSIPSCMLRLLLLFGPGVKAHWYRQP